MDWCGLGVRLVDASYLDAYPCAQGDAASVRCRLCVETEGIGHERSRASYAQQGQDSEGFQVGRLPIQHSRRIVDGNA
jgi:hypothetical protein